VAYKVSVEIRALGGTGSYNLLRLLSLALNLPVLFRPTAGRHGSCGMTKQAYLAILVEFFE
jgi:hypothetical protein